MPARKPARESRAPWLLLALAVLAGTALYLPSLDYGFVWDDRQLITANPAIETDTPLALFGRGFMLAGHGSQSRRVQYYRPLAALSFWLDHRARGMNPRGFHLTNVLLNGLVLVLLALLLLELLRRDGRYRRWPVLLGVLAFGVHPAHVESVAFISGRTDLLAAVFVLIAALLILRLRRTGSFLFAVLGAASFALALLAKEVAILFPAVAALLLGWTRAERRRSLMALGLLILTAASYLVLRFAVLGPALPPAAGGAGHRLTLVLNSLGRYAGLLVFPFRHRLLWPDAAEFARPGWPTAAGAALLVGLVWLAVRYRRGPAGTGAAWTLLFLLPAANLFPIGSSLLAERLLYLPSAGAILLALAAGLGLRDIRARRALAWLLTGYCLVLGFAAWNRMPAWRDEMALFRVAVTEAPESADAHLNLGAELLRAGDAAGAERELRRAVELRPGEPIARNNLGDLLRRTGRLEEAADQLRTAVRLDAGYAEAWGNLGIVHSLAGRNDSAYLSLARARELNPDLAAAHINLGNVFVALGKPDSAIASLWAAARLRPDRPEPWVNLERLYRALGKNDSADLVRGLFGR